MLNLSLEGAERYVSGKDNAWWDGWTMLIFSPRPSAATRPDGAFHNGQWGILRRVEPNDKGRYRFNA